MLRVTVFGVFLTPVFFYVLGWFGGGSTLPAAHPGPAEGMGSTGVMVVPTDGH